MLWEVFCLLCVRGPLPSLQFCGEKSGDAGGSTLLVAISRFFDLQAIPLLAEVDGNTDKLPWAQNGLISHTNINKLLIIPAWSIPLRSVLFKGCWVTAKQTKIAARAKSRLDFVPSSVVSSHHHYHKIGCQHVAQSMRNTEICSGWDSGGRNATLVPEPTIRTEGQWWHSGCLTLCSCVSAKDILLSWGF